MLGGRPVQGPSRVTALKKTTFLKKTKRIRLIDLTIDLVPCVIDLTQD